MWRDEYQAWMVASEADTIAGLFLNLKYEGHPSLWYILLFVISSVVDHPFAMQLLHIFLSAGAVYLINRHAPFPLWQRILLTFGYFVFYEYNIISRSYAPGLLLLLGCCVLFEQRRKMILWIAALLFLMTNTSVFGVVFSCGIAGIILLEQLFFLQKGNRLKIPVLNLSLFLVIVLIGVSLGYYQIKPETENSFIADYRTEMDASQLRAAFSSIIQSYFPLPRIDEFHSWNTNFFVRNPGTFPVYISIVVFLIGMLTFLRHRLILLLYFGCTLVMLGLFYYTNLMYARYTGHLFLLLIVCHWLSHFTSEKAFNNGYLNHLSLAGKKIQVPILAFVLIIGLAGGLYSYSKDLVHPFSTSGEAANYIRENHLDKHEMIGSKDYVVSPLTEMLNKEILYVERKEPGTFIIYDLKRSNLSGFNEIQSTILNSFNQHRQKITLIRSEQIFMTFTDTNESIPWEEGWLPNNLKMKFLKKIEPGIVEDEDYYIYAIEQQQ